jgi:hypothetical protein
VYLPWSQCGVWLSEETMAPLGPWGQGSAISDVCPRPRFGLGSVSAMAFSLLPHCTWHTLIWGMTLLSGGHPTGGSGRPTGVIADFLFSLFVGTIFILKQQTSGWPRSWGRCRHSGGGQGWHSRVWGICCVSTSQASVSIPESHIDGGTAAITHTQPPARG